MPGYPLSGRYAGVVVWLDKAAGREGSALGAWLKKQIEAGCRLSFWVRLRFLFDSGDAKQLGDAILNG